MTGLLEKYDHAIKRYLHSKTTINPSAQQYMPRIKDGMTLSQLFRGLSGTINIVIRTRDYCERFPVENLNMCEKNFFIWKEDGKFIMGAGCDADVAKGPK